MSLNDLTAARRIVAIEAKRMEMGEPHNYAAALRRFNEIQRIVRQ